MKLNSIQINQTPATGKGRFGGETKEERKARMANWFKSQSVGLIPLGKFLAREVNKDGRTAADLVAKGEFVELPDSLNVKGVDLPLAPGQTISLKNVAAWGCPACHSAHGTGTLMSKDVNVLGLQANKFYYSVKDRRIFAVSATCYGASKGYDFDANAHFVEPESLKVQKPAVPAVQQKPATVKAERSMKLSPTEYNCEGLNPPASGNGCDPAPNPGNCSPKAHMAGGWRWSSLFSHIVNRCKLLFHELAPNARGSSKDQL